MGSYAYIMGVAENFTKIVEKKYRMAEKISKIITNRKKMLGIFQVNISPIKQNEIDQTATVVPLDY